jgi:type IV pilus assembly protein PilM
MVRRRKQQKAGPVVGLEIAADAIRAVEMKAQGRELLLQHLAETASPAGSVSAGRIMDPVAVAGALRQLWEQAGFSTRRCVVAMPAETLTPQMLILPPAPPDEQRQIVRGELARFTTVQNDTAFGWMPLAAGDGPSGNTLAFLSQGEVIAEYREALGMAGLEMASCEPDAIASLRAIPTARFQQDAVAAIYISSTCSEIAFLDGGRARYYRRLDQGLADGSGIPGGSARIDDEGHDPLLAQFLTSHALAAARKPAGDKELEQLVLEIKRSLQYYARAYHSAPQPQRLLLLGDHPLLDRLTGILGEELRLEAQVIDPLSLHPHAARQPFEVGAGCGARYTVALGMALRPFVDSKAGFALDMKTPDETQALARHAPRYLMASLAGSTALVVAALGVSMLLEVRLTAAQSRLNGIEAQLQAANLERQQSMARAQQARTEIARLRKEALPVPLVLTSLGALVPDALSLTNVDLKEDGSMSLDGEARGPHQVNNLLQRLSCDARFSTPNLQTLDAGAEQGAVHFQVQTGLVGYSKPANGATSQ